MLAGLTYRFENRPLGIVEFAKIEERIGERLALLESTAKWVTRFSVVWDHEKRPLWLGPNIAKSGVDRNHSPTKHWKC